MPSALASRPKKSTKWNPVSRRCRSRATIFGGAANASALCSGLMTPSSCMRPST